MSDNDQPLAIALPRSDWLLVEQALLIAVVHDPLMNPTTVRRWLDILAKIAADHARAAREAQRRRMAQR